MQGKKKNKDLSQDRKIKTSHMLERERRTEQIERLHLQWNILCHPDKESGFRVLVRALVQLFFVEKSIFYSSMN